MMKLPMPKITGRVLFMNAKGMLLTINITQTLQSWEPEKMLKLKCNRLSVRFVIENGVECSEHYVACGMAAQN